VLEKVVDVRRRRGRVRLVEVPVGVGGADQPVATPRDHEEHALLRAEQKTHVGLEPVAWHDQVHALGGPHLELAALSHHRLCVIRPHTGRVHDLLRTDVEPLARLQVVGPGTDHALTHLDEALDAHPASHVGAVEGCRARERRGVASVVDLCVVVGDAADERVTGEARDRSHHLRLCEVTVVRHAGRPTAGVAEDVVEQHARTDV
jgi:hypothetical protein